MIHRTHCPVCNAQESRDIFNAKDYTVSQSEFKIVECINCTHRYTQDVPDANEIGPYYKAESYISHTDTKSDLISKLYHYVRNITLKGKRSLVQKYTRKSTGKILDVGCGTGAFLFTMKQAGWEVEGLEPDETASKIALEKHGIITQDPGKIYQLQTTQYDAITMWHVMEHVHDLQGYCATLKKLLKPGGVLFVAVPNYTSYDAHKYQQYWAAYDVPRHLYHFSPNSMEKLLQQHGMKIVATKPMWFDSFYVSMLSEQYKHKKSRLISALFTGLISNLKAMMDKKTCSSIIYIIKP